MQLHFPLLNLPLKRNLAGIMAALCDMPQVDVLLGHYGNIHPSFKHKLQGNASFFAIRGQKVMWGVEDCGVKWSQVT